MWDALNWRYAVKKFDPNRKIGPETLDSLMEALRLAPSSFGLQPWKFLVVSNPETKQALFPHSWGNRQVLECSHLVVLCSRAGVGESDVQDFLSDYASKVDPHKFNFGAYGNSIRNFVAQLDGPAKHRWMSEQVHIALGVLLVAAATMRVDSCPMGGFLPTEYAKVLGLEEKGLKPVVLCALGYRSEDDPYSAVPKVRFERKRIFEFVE